MRTRLWLSGVTAQLFCSIVAVASVSGPTIQNCEGPMRKIV